MTYRPPPLVVLMLLAMVSACTTTPQPDATSKPEVARCQQLFVENDALLRNADSHDAQAARVTGYTFLRVDRLLVSLAAEAHNNAQRQAWLARAMALDAEGRGLELARLSPAPDGSVIEQLQTCRAMLGAALHDDDNAWRAMLGGAQVADDYRTTRRVLGVYPISARVVLAGVAGLQAREMPRLRDHPAVTGPATKRYSLASDTNNETSLPAAAPWRRDALGLPLFSELEVATLLRRHAPEIAVDIRSADDYLGRVTHNRAPFVDSSQAVLYTQLAYTRFDGQVLPQLVYTWWFAARTARGPVDPLAGPLDGLSWRVTLDIDGQPLAYDLVHNCGCYHMLFPGPRLRTRPATNGLQEPPWVPFSIPTHWQGRLQLALASGSHYLTAIAPATATAPHQSYTLQAYRQLRALPLGAQRVSLFDAHGLVPGSARGERWFLWPMGIVAPGSMRQWGHQPTAFVGRRHFDDARLFERYFERVDSASAASRD